MGGLLIKLNAEMIDTQDSNGTNSEFIIIGPAETACIGMLYSSGNASSFISLPTKKKTCKKASLTKPVGGTVIGLV